MKKFLFALAFAGLTSSAAVAQETEIPTQKYSVATNRFWSNWFIQGSGFYGTYSVGNQSWDFYKGANSNPGFGVALGKWFTPSLGLRAKYQGLKYKYADVKDDGHLARFDAMFNLCNMFGGYNAKRVVDLSIFTGMGKFIEQGMLWDMGMNVNVKLCKRLGLFVEGSLMMIDNQGKWYNFYRGWGGRYFTTEMGLSLNLGKVGWSKTPDVDAIMALNKSQLDALNAQLADAEAENAKLKALLAQKPKTQEVVKTVKEVQTTPASVFFNINSSKIASKKDLVNVQELVNLAKANGSTLVVTGYADSKTGSAAYNQSLSEKRANAVADKLVEMGVSRDKIQVVAKGGVDNLTPFSYNRRVTVEIK